MTAWPTPDGELSAWTLLAATLAGTSSSSLVAATCMRTMLPAHVATALAMCATVAREPEDRAATHLWLTAREALGQVEAAMAALHTRADLAAWWERAS